MYFAVSVNAIDEKKTAGGGETPSGPVEGAGSGAMATVRFPLTK